MKRPIKHVFLGALIFLFLVASESAQVSTLTYSELLSRQTDYVGKRVRVTGYWFTFFEVSALHSKHEREFRKSSAWVEFVDEDDLCKGSHGKLKKLNEKYAGDAQVIFIGRLYSGGGYGHMGSYEYKFVVDCVEQIKKLPRNQRTIE